jgi:hypothetical protein
MLFFVISFEDFFASSKRRLRRRRHRVSQKVSHLKVGLYQRVQMK